MTVKLLMALPGSEPSENNPLDTLVNVDTFLVFSVLFCGNNLESKAEGLFMCLNPPNQAQDGISATDKDWAKVF